MEKVTRAWKALAPKLVAFLATGLTASTVIAVLHAVGIELDPGFAAYAVTIVSAVASYVVKDNLLDLPWNALAPKFIVFVLSSVTASGLVTFLSFIHVSIDPAIAGVVVTLVSVILGYVKSDSTGSVKGAHAA